MYEGAPYVDEWKPLPPRLHDQRTLERVVELPGGLRVAAREVSAAEYAEFLAAIGEPALTDASPDLPATGMTFARAREFAAWAGGRLPTEDEWQLARGGGRIPAPRTDRVELDRVRAQRRPHAVRHAQGRLGPSCRGVRLVLRRRGAASGVLGEAAPARTRGGCLVVHRIPGVLGGGRGMGALDGLTVIDVSTLFAGPMAAMHLGDMGAAVIKVEHPTRPDPGARTRPLQGRPEPVVEDPRTQQADDRPRPAHRRRARGAAAPGRDRRRRDRELPAGDPRAMGPRLRRPLRAQSRASSSRASPGSGRRDRTGRGRGSARSPRR